MFPSTIFDNFFDIGQKLAGAVAPYSLHLLWLLVFIELVTVAITYMMGSDDPTEILWRIVRLVFTGGFSYWWLVNAWALGIMVIGSFHAIGENITGVPNLTPTQLWATGFDIVKTMWMAPSATGVMPNPAVALGIILMAIVIAVMFTSVAVICLFFISGTLLILGPGSIFVSFMPCRFLTSLSENYFIWLIRMGAGILGFYIVFYATKNLAAQWLTTLNTACHPIGAVIRVPMAGGPPAVFHASVCSQPISFDTLLSTFEDVIILAFLGISVPFLMAAFAGGGVHLALENFAAAKYLGGSAMRSLGRGIGGLTHAIQRMVHNSSQQTTLQQRMAAGAAAARASSGAATTPLTPPSSPGGGWKGRPAGPPLAPPPNGSSGSGGAALEYYPGRPSAQTRAEAIDITKLQKR